MSGFTRILLFRLTLLYLLLPWGLFLLGWLRPVWAWPIGLSLLLAFWLTTRAGAAAWSKLSKTEIQRTFILGAIALFFCIVTGVGEFFPQKGDYDKHNLMFQDLIRFDAPVVYQNATYDNPILCYYIAYYLPVAALTKLTGSLAWANEIALIWTFSGVFLLMVWLYRLTQPVGWWGIALFWLSSGLDVPLRWYWLWQFRFGGDLGRFIQEYALWKVMGLKFYVPPFTYLSDGLAEHQLVFQSPLVQFQWTPHHALGGWLATAAVLAVYRRQYPVVALPLICAATLLWSPFVTIGLMPLALYIGIRQRAWTLRLFWVSTAVAVLMSTVCGLYYLAHFSYQYAGWLFTAFQNLKDVSLYLLYLIVYTFLPVWLLWRLYKAYPALPGNDAGLLAIFAVSTVAVSTFYMGKYNDFLHRTVIPAQLVLVVLLASAIGVVVQNRLRHWSVYGLVAYLLIGAYYPIRELTSAVWAIRKPPLVDRRISRATINFGEADVSRILRDSTAPGTDFAAQYLGRRDSFFGRYLMKKTTDPAPNP
ncbi:MAG: hypothetical protein LH606_13720 [Cytophagaceae bacterium]|nr:hypothetical protein [Cytophagaceae bacterium]